MASKSAIAIERAIATEKLDKLAKLFESKLGVKMPELPRGFIKQSGEYKQAKTLTRFTAFLADVADVLGIAGDDFTNFDETKRAEINERNARIIQGALTSAAPATEETYEPAPAEVRPMP